MAIARPRPWLACGLFALAAAVCAWQAYPMLFGQFAPYDDEGYLLVSVKAWLRGGRLYDDIYSQYGPFYYQAMSALFTGLRMPVDHDHAGLVTIAFWVAGSLACGFIAHAISGRLLVSLSVVLLAFLGLFGLRSEPMHPLGLLSVLIAGAVSLPIVLRRHPRTLLFLLGAVATAVAMVKINVGGFLAISLAFALVLSLPARGICRLPRGLMAALVVLVPVVLTMPRFDLPWVRVYALHVAVAAAAVGIVSLRLELTSVEPRQLPWFPLGGLLALAAICGAAVLRGTSPRALLDAVLVLPLRMPSVFIVPMRFNPAVVPLELLAIAGALVWLVRGGKGGAWAGPLRLLAGTVLCSASGLFFPVVPQSLFALPLVFTALIPPRSLGEDRRHMLARCVLVLVEVLQALHGYPVAGSQVDLSTFLLIPIGGVCIADGLHELAERAPRLPAIAGAVMLAGVSVWFTVTGQEFHDNYRYNPQMPFPGTQRLHIDKEQLDVYIWLVGELDRRCATFVTVPGLNSLHLFSGIEPPTSFNTTSWMFLLDDETQSKIVEKISRVPALCAVRNVEFLRSWQQENELPQGPLLRYVERELQPVAARQGYELMVRREGGR
jgi:hypothetical protein